MKYAYMQLYEYYKVDIIMLPSAQQNFSADTVGRNHEGNTQEENIGYVVFRPWISWEID
jgi:hypothetical protein